MQNLKKKNTKAFKNMYNVLKQKKNKKDVKVYEIT